MNKFYRAVAEELGFRYAYDGSADCPDALARKEEAKTCSMVLVARFKKEDKKFPERAWWGIFNSIGKNHE